MDDKPTPDSRAEERNFALVQINAHLASIAGSLESIAKSLRIQVKESQGIDVTYGDLKDYFPPRYEEED